MIAAIIQARMGSRRLPGKVLLPIANTTVIGFMIERVMKAKKLDKIIVATTENSVELLLRLPKIQLMTFCVMHWLIWVLTFFEAMKMTC